MSNEHRAQNHNSGKTSGTFCPSHNQIVFRRLFLRNGRGVI